MIKTTFNRAFERRNKGEREIIMKHNKINNFGASSSSKENPISSCAPYNTK